MHWTFMEVLLEVHSRRRNLKPKRSGLLFLHLFPYQRFKIYDALACSKIDIMVHISMHKFLNSVPSTHLAYLFLRKQIFLTGHEVQRVLRKLYPPCESLIPVCCLNFIHMFQAFTMILKYFQNLLICITYKVIAAKY